MLYSANNCIIFFILVVSALIENTMAAQSRNLSAKYCSSQFEYSNFVDFRTNLVNFFYGSLRYSNLPYTGIFNATLGNGPNKLYGLFLCNHGISPEDCLHCCQSAAENLPSECPRSKNAILWYDDCFLHYSNIPLISSNSSYVACLDRPGNTTGPVGFNQTVMEIFQNLTHVAAWSPSRQAEKKVWVRDLVILWGEVQCTPFMSTEECEKCLRSVGNHLPQCVGPEKSGGRLLAPNCNMRYGFYRLIERERVSAPAPLPYHMNINSSFPRRVGRERIFITEIIAVNLALIFLGLAFGYCTYNSWKRKTCNQEYKEGDMMGQSLYHGGVKPGSFHGSVGSFTWGNEGQSEEFPLIDLDVIYAATEHFSETNKLGHGGFGPVYKGTLLNGKEIAVKRLGRTSLQGLQEFRNEVTLIAKLQHRNLVRLHGCCLEENELLLVYEYMPNRSLDTFLFDTCKGRELDWEKRFGIICGIARGLLYLHEDSHLRIVHRDLKASNILLGNDMNPKISDFGMARILYGNENVADTGRIVGTIGYMAPEYAMEGVCSIKSDVFSFGVLLLEIISGKKNSSYGFSTVGLNFVNMAWMLWSDGRCFELADPLLAESFVVDEFLKCIQIGLLCVQDNPDDRPSMSFVVSLLNNSTPDLPSPLQPTLAGLRDILGFPPVGSSSIKMHSINNVSISALLPR